MISFYESQKLEDDGFEGFMDSYFKILYDIISKSMHILQRKYPEIEELPRIMRQVRHDNFASSTTEYTTDFIDCSDKNQNKAVLNYQNNTILRNTILKKQFLQCPINPDESLLVNVGEKKSLEVKKRKENCRQTNKSPIANELVLHKLSSNVCESLTTSHENELLMIQREKQNSYFLPFNQSKGIPTDISHSKVSSNVNQLSQSSISSLPSLLDYSKDVLKTVNNNSTLIKNNTTLGEIQKFYKNIYQASNDNMSLHCSNNAAGKLSKKQQPSSNAFTHVSSKVRASFNSKSKKKCDTNTIKSMNCHKQLLKKKYDRVLIEQ